MRLLVAIPVFNERKHVQSVLDKVHRYCNDILCIDDGSTDGTGELLEQMKGQEAQTSLHLIRHKTNLGYGQSIIDAFNYADANGYDWVITMDCDEQHEPERIPDFVRQIKTDRWDIISGSRYLESGTDDDLPPGDRQAINAEMTVTINELFGWSLTDTFCGFKAHRVSAMKQLKLDEPGYAFPMQLWPRAHKVGLRITETPVRLIYNDPNRYFGGRLDDAAFRLAHYKQVLQAELRRLAEQPDATDEVCACCYCD